MCDVLYLLTSCKIPMADKIRITVFTPVFNRAYCVRNVYNSLLKQTFHDFEWLVINDGSTDDTDKVINECIAENKITIRYFSKQNGGQHRALNDAIRYAKGQLLMIVDSDDDLNGDALYWIDYYEKTVTSKDHFAGVSGLRCHRDGRVIGLPWPDNSKEYIDITNIQRYKNNTLLGDKAEAYYVDVLKKFSPIPEFENENDVEKGVLWNRIAFAGLKIRWFNKAIYNCEYLEDGMSKNITTHYLKNFNGYSFYIKEFLKYDIGIWRKIKTIIVYCEIARAKKCTIKNISQRLNLSYGLIFICYIISYISPLRFRFRAKNL